MTIGVEIKNPPDEILAKVEKGLKGRLPRAMLLAAEVAAGDVRRQIASRLRQHTGHLGASYDATLLKSRKVTELRSGAVSDLVYARIQDEGGTVEAVNAKALTVPLTTKAKRFSREGQSARSFSPKLHMVWPKGRRTGWLVEHRKRKPIMHFLLKRSVRIPGVKYLDAAAQMAEPKIEKIVNAGIQKVCDGVK